MKRSLAREDAERDYSGKENTISKCLGKKFRADLKRVAQAPGVVSLRAEPKQQVGLH